MSRRAAVLTALLLLTLCGSLPGSLSAAAPRAKPLARDWQKHPAIVEIPDTPKDLYAVGDPHGDYERLLAVLLAGKIIPEAPVHAHEVRWSGDKAVLVCTGDLIDKGKHSLKVLKLFRALQTAADKAGGRVIVTMGNHEAEFLTDPFNRKAVEFKKELDDNKLDAKAVAAGRDAEGIGVFLRSLPLAARVGDWFFAHAGHTRGRSLKQLRQELEEGIDNHGYNIPALPALTGLLEARLHDLPWWAKEGDTEAASAARLAGQVKMVGARHLVIGHQPGNVRFSEATKRKKGTLYQWSDGLLFLIDVGMSRGINDTHEGYSKGTLLHIHQGRTATALYPDQPPRQLWTEKLGPSGRRDEGSRGPAPLLPWTRANRYTPSCFWSSTMSFLVLSTIATSSARSADGTWNLSNVWRRSSRNARHSCSVMSRWTCESYMDLPV